MAAVEQPRQKEYEVKILAKKLAEIAEKSPGYSVTLSGGWELTDIQFRRNNGRRDRSMVEAKIDGKYGAWNSDTMLELKD